MMLDIAMSEIHSAETAACLGHTRPLLRALFLTVVPSPYMRELFQAMHTDGRIAPNVVYQAMSLPGFDWGVQTLNDWEQVLPPSKLRSPGQGISRLLADSKADVFVVAGYASPTMQLAMRWLHRNRRPWVFFGERPAMSQRGPAGRLARSLAMRPVAKWPNAIAAAGQEAVEAYRRFCRESIPVENVPYYTDLSSFRNSPASPGSVCGRCRLLFCGQLIERKGIHQLLIAFNAIAATRPGLELTIVGDGPLRKRLEAQVPDSLKTRVSFAGFRPVAELPKFFAAADVFVLPSLHDGWGVVVNQALGAGLPIIASDAVGAAGDLVEHGRNGLIYPAGDIETLRRTLERLVDDPVSCQRFGKVSRDVSKRADLAAGVDAWCRLLTRVRESTPSRSQAEGRQAGIL